jgi:enoyl-CoA hydratase/carnithine racemase
VVRPAGRRLPEGSGTGVFDGAGRFVLDADRADEVASTWSTRCAAVTAREAEQTGMVNRVVELDRLQDETMDLARQIAKTDAFALRQAKRAVSQTLDIQGFTLPFSALTR